MSCTIVLTCPDQPAARSRLAPDWFAHWIERSRREHARRRLLRASELLLRRAQERAAADGSYAADLEAAALAGLERADAMRPAARGAPAGIAIIGEA